MQSQLSKRTSALTLELEKLRGALPPCEAFIDEYLGKVQKVEVKSANSIKDNHVPATQVNYKAKQHWKTITSMVVDGGAGVNVMSEHTKKVLGITPVKSAPFRV